MNSGSKPWLLGLALFLSVGFNLGLLASRWLPAAGPRPSAEGSVQDQGSETGPRAENLASGEATVRARGPEVDRLEGTWPPPLRRMVVRMADELELTGDQRQAFFDLERNFFERTLRQRKQVRMLQGQLRRALGSEPADPDEARRILEHLIEAQRELEQTFVDHVFAARELLDRRQMARYRRFLGHLRRVGQELGGRGPMG